MADYVLVHDREAFEGEVRPALARAWSGRNFAPLLAHAPAWGAAAREYARRYYVAEGELLLTRLEGGLPFDRDVWRLLVAEVLLVTAVEMPELPAHLGALGQLLAPGRAADVSRRGEMAEVHQALHGSRDVRFGSAVYRPGHAGLNDAGDVGRLAGWLEGVRPGEWTAVGLEGDEEERAEELAYAREWFEAVREVYRRAAGAGRVVVVETIY